MRSELRIVDAAVEGQADPRADQRRRHGDNAAQIRNVRSRKPAMPAETRARNSTLMLKGWLTPRCSSLPKPRSCAQIAGAGPLRLAMPPSTPPMKPTAASAGATATRHDRRAAHEGHPRAVDDQQDADADLERVPARTWSSRSVPIGTPTMPADQHRPQTRPAHAAPDASAGTGYVAGDAAEGGEGGGREGRHGLQPEAQRHQRVAGAAQSVDEACRQRPGDDDRDVAGGRQDPRRTRLRS